MSQFNARDLAHLKKLCRIECSKEEDEDILASLKRVLEYVNLLNEVDVENCRPCNFVLKGMTKTTLRKDEVLDLMPREQLLANSPDHIAGMIRVPPILKPL